MSFPFLVIILAESYLEACNSPSTLTWNVCVSKNHNGFLL